MKKLIAFTAVMLELGIIAGLLFKHLELYHSIKLLFLLFIPILFFIHWVILNKELLTKKGHLTLLLLTGPCLILTFSLISNLSYDLKVASQFGSPFSKEVVIIINKGTWRTKFIPQWKEGSIDKLRSERFIYIMLLMGTCILYGVRYSMYRNQYVARIQPECKDPPVVDNK